MSPKPPIRTAQLQLSTQRDVWADSFWALLQERSLRMGAATGGRRMLMEDTIILTQRPTAEVIIMGGMVIIMRHLTITPPQEPTAGNRLHMAPTDRRRPAGPLTILTPEPVREAHRYPRRMGAEVPHKPITRTPERMLRHAKVRTRMLNGKARMFREETRALLWAITLLQMEL